MVACWVYSPPARSVPGVWRGGLLSTLQVLALEQEQVGRVDHVALGDDLPVAAVHRRLNLQD